MSFKEKLLDSQIIYEGRIFNLRKDELKMSSGVEVVREIVDHPGAVAVVPMLTDQTVLMVRQYRHPAGKVLLEIPAGTLERGEKPQECAERELIEETGYQSGRLTKLLQCFLAPGYSSELIHIYSAMELSKVKHRSEVDEYIRVSEVKISRVLAMIKSKKIEDAKTICGILTFIYDQDNRRHQQIKFA